MTLTKTNGAGPSAAMQVQKIYGFLRDFYTDPQNKSHYNSDYS
jgi:hypothetical protein